MQILQIIGILILSYLIGAIPVGLIVVKFMTGKDVRNVQSGRTGGTNAMRTAGFWAGLITAVLDILKAACTVWISRAVLPGNHWMEVIAPILAIIGHNYSIYIIKKQSDGKYKIHGGAGGAPSAGGALGLWAPSILIIFPIAAILLYFVGYASVVTMSMPIIAIIIFTIRAIMGLSPWSYVVYGIIAELILIWALRPNIKRLFEGTERVVGYRARKSKPPADESSTGE